METEGFDQILFDVICRFASIFFSNTLPISLPQILPFTILIQINPEVKYEMLNYNPLASAKYELVNLKYGLESYQMFTKQQMQHFYDVALQAGIKNLIKE